MPPSAAFAETIDTPKAFPKRKKPARTVSAPVGLPAEPEVLDSIARIGTGLFDMPVAIRAADSEPGVGSGASLFDAPFLRFRKERDLVGESGAALGKLALIDLASRSELEPAKIALLDDLDTLASAYLESRQAIGRTDHVTLLPNRLRFLDDIAKLADESTSGEQRFSILLVTLADARMFNEVLRALGHSYADDFVRIGSALLRELVPQTATLYHVSVLSFAMVLPADALRLETLAERIVASFAKPLICNGLPLATRVGVGLTDFDPCDGRAAENLRAALTAAQDSRQLTTGWSRYNKAADEAQRRAFTLLSDLREAIASKDQLSLHFQPRVAMKSGVCVSAEALLRWNHPRLGAISPGEFLPLVETTAMIGPLTNWVFKAGIGQIGQWKKRGIDLTLALNVSPNNLRDRGFADNLKRMLATARIDPRRVELEFTEGALTTNEPQVHGEIEGIRKMGIEIAIDDFGTGYSNMNYLTRLPAQIIKIDQSFVRTMSGQPRQQLLVRSIMEMAHALGFRVVAEGIETTETYDMLRGWGCEEGQGYLMSRPLPSGDFASWLAANQG